MAIVRNGNSTTVAATNGVASQAFAVAPGGTLLTGIATMLASFAIISPNATPITVSSVTDSQGNTWTKVTEQADGAGWDTTQINGGVQRGHTNSVWITKNATINTTITITATFSGTTDVCVGAFSPKFSGVNTVQPLDQNASLPKVLKEVTNTVPTLAGISTNTSSIWPISFMSMFSGSIGTSNFTFNGVAQDDASALQQNGTQFVKNHVAGGPAVASAYSSVSFVPSSACDNVWHIGLVLTADAQATPTKTYATVIS